MHGLINLLKPPGMTSHDAVAFVRRALKIKRVGHTGTLDPAAAGVLPICVGQATRLAEYLQAGRKTYIAEATFGYETDTLDGVGRVLREGDATGVNLESIRAALDAFRGEIEQIPPAFSAIKRDGQKLYDLARAGQLDESALAPRRVTIHAARPTRFVEGPRPRALLHVECSTGTYVRSLVRDLGRALGCGATMTFLVRTHSGAFAIGDAAPLEAIAAQPQSALLPMAQVFKLGGFPVVVSDELARDLAQGKRVPAGALERLRSQAQIAEGKETGAFTYHPTYLVVANSDGTIAAIAAPDEALCYKPEKVLFLD